MMKYVLFVVGLLIYTQACSQTLSGDILDPLGQPVDVANIILFSLPDSNYVNGVVTYDGTFSIDITDPSSSLLQITALGFRDYWVEDLDVKKRIEVKMMAASVALKEAIVKAKIPQFQQKNGILNVNVENTNLSASGTAMDVLKRTPGLFLTRDENSVQMFGKGNVKIFLDGQEVQSIDIIKSLNSEEIVKIEVIRNPSAKYDAEGKGGVINIITKNSRLEGLLGNITLNTTKATFNRSFIQSDLSYKKGKWGVFGSMSWNPNKTFNEEHFTRIVTQPNAVFRLNNNIQTTATAWLNNNFSTKISYRITPYQTIKLGYRGRLETESSNTKNINNIFNNDLLFEKITSTSNGKDKLFYGITDLQYQLSDTIGRVLTLSGNHTDYLTNKQSLIDEKFIGKEVLHRKSKADGKIQILIARVDYEQPVFNKFMKAMVGFKFSSTRNDANTDFYTRKKKDKPWKSTGKIADVINYSEKETAIYTELTKEIGKWSFRAGGRYEQSIADASSVFSGNYYDTTYQNIFPSAMIEYSFTDEIVANLTYAKRIERPDFYDLNPFFSYLDSFSLLKGNPSLIPEIVNEIEFNGSYSGYPLLTLGYSITRNPINILVETDPNNPLVNVGVTSNLAYEEKYHGQIILPYKNPWWTSGNGFGYSWRFLKDDVFNEGKVFRKEEKFVFSYQDFNVKDWNFGGQYVWFGPGLEGIFQYSSGWFVNLWLGKKFLDGKLSARLTADDIFKSQIVTAHATIGKLYVEQSAYYDTRRVRLTMKYKFGQLKSQVNLKTKRNSEHGRIKL